MKHRYRHRTASVGAALLLVLGTAGCDTLLGGDGEAEEEVEDLTIVVEADKSRILEEEAELIKKREAMESERGRLSNERADIVKKLASLSKKDRKARVELEAEKKRLDEEERRVRNRSQQFESERARLEKQKNDLLERISTMTSRKGGLTIEEREGRLAGREKDLARREKDLAEREAKLAARESEAAGTLKQLNSVLADLKGGGLTRTVVVSGGGGGGGSATKTQASNSRKGLQRKMDSKGILMDDLPPTAKSLYRQAQSAMSDKEYGDAVSAYGQVQSIVDSITINQSFVQGKMQRLNRAISSKRLDDKRKKRVQGLLAEVGEAAADGRYDRANKKANQIAMVLGGR